MIKLLHPSLFLAGAATLLAVSLARSQNGALQEQPAQLTQVSAIADGMEKAREGIKCAQAKVSYYRSTPKEYFQWISSLTPDDPDDKEEPKSLTQIGTSRWYVKDGRLAMTVKIPSRTPEDAELFRISTDSKQARILHQLTDASAIVTSSRSQGSGGVVPANKILLDGMWRSYIRFDPRSYITHGGAPLTVDYPRQFAEDGGKFEGQEEVFGALCSKIGIQRSPSEKITFWIDTQHGFLIRKQQGHYIKNGVSKLDSELNTPEITGSNGHWLPAKIEETYFWGIEAGKPKAEPIVTRVEISDFSADCNIPEEVFQIDWPNKTVVNDEVNKREFMVVDQNLSTLATGLPRAEDDPNVEIASARPTVKVNQEAPNFVVRDMQGKEWKLSDLKGKKNVLLTFFPKCFTGGCANHLSSLRDHQGEFDAAGTQILAVSVDAAEGEKGQKAFAAQWKFGFPLIPDTTRALSKLFGAVQTNQQLSARMSILIDKSGIVRWIDTNVDVQTHGADVLSKIRELGLDK